MFLNEYDSLSDSILKNLNEGYTKNWYIHYIPGSGETIISEELAEEMSKAIEEKFGYIGQTIIRGGGKEAKVEGKPEIVEFLKEKYPDIVKGEEVNKGNRVSLRLDTNSKMLKT